MPTLLRRFAAQNRANTFASPISTHIESIRRLSGKARAYESKKFPPMLEMTIRQMSPDAKVCLGAGIIDCMNSLHLSDHDALSRLYPTQVLASILVAKNAPQKTTDDMLTLARTFYEIFVENQSDAFVKTLLSTNELSESQCPEVVSNPPVLRTWLRNVHEFEDRPEILGKVLESLLSGAGKAMYQLDQTIKGKNGEETTLCVFKKSGLTEEARHLRDVIKAYGGDELRQVYARGSDGSFADINKAIVDISTVRESPAHIIYPDGIASVNTRGIRPPKLMGNHFNATQSLWLQQAAERGIITQYGPSGTTRSSLCTMAILKRSKGIEFFKQDPSKFMDVVTHAVMIPYLKAGYHTPAEVMVAVNVFINSLEGNDSSEVIHAAECQRQALAYMVHATKRGAVREAVQGLCKVVNDFSDKLGSAYTDYTAYDEFNHVFNTYAEKYTSAANASSPTIDYKTKYKKTAARHTHTVSEEPSPSEQETPAQRSPK